MRLKSILSTLLVSSLLLTSCNKDEEFGGAPVTPQAEGETGYAKISLQDAPLGYSGATHATGSDAENKINVLEFYVFKGDVRDPKAGAKDASGTVVTPGYVKITTISANNEYLFAVTAEEALTIVTAVNLNLGNGTEIQSLTDLKKAIHDVAITNPTGVSESGIPMSGEESGIIVGVEDTKRVKINVSRLYSRLNAPQKASGFSVSLTDEELERLNEETQQSFEGTNIEFTLEGHVVINGLTQSFAYPNYGVSNEFEKWLSSIWTIGNDVTKYTKSVYDNKQLGSVYSGGSYLGASDVVYVYENSPALTTSSGGYSGFDPAAVYAYIIKATLKEGSNEAERYWRINLAKTATHGGTSAALYQVLRNAIYNMNIKTVTTAGYETPEEAEEDKEIIPNGEDSGVIVEITVADWRVFDEEQNI